jgi:membrane protein YqaA with SNARE-associated domain
MSTRGTVSWLGIIIMCQSEATCLPRSSELARNHDNVVEWSHMSTSGAVSWLGIMIMCQSEATCLPAESELALNHDNVSK